VIGRPAFVTWRLFGTLPANRSFQGGSLSSGQAFAAMDLLLDRAQTGPSYLRRPEIARMLMTGIHHGAGPLQHYELHAFVVMPNHVHLLITPAVELRKLTMSLKSVTAKHANRILGLTGQPFWQDESYDRVVRDETEFDGIRAYIEANPVRAGLAGEPGDYPWSSANRSIGSNRAIAE
jgi:REP element-mobilizing transposase RayT